ncbi:MAG: alpha-N-arabinofuranosidase [Bacteroidales bacterium]|nr:alpha-N-arabinofuranosidase [Bacteroidales bacterium]
MKRLMLCAVTASAIFTAATAAERQYTLTLTPQEDSHVISRMIYGQFAEHLGACIYEGIWVGEDSDIPNTNGYRNDALEALRELAVPVLRWPGGCFADDYHWRDGIGARDTRPTLINNNWGGTKEDNSFGTHEFFNLCEMLGIEPYLSVNVGSGTVAEAAEWIEYITAPNGPRADERAANGRKEPWKLKYVGIGNESWGCGGEMRPEYYSDVYRRYNVYMRNQPGNRLYRIASGASDYNFNWTETLMKQIEPHRMDGISLHYYTVSDWGHKGSATDFTDDVYYTTVGKALEIEPVIEHHREILDKYDPQGKVGLLVDEWGTWFDEEPGSTPGHLLQQNTMRDAIVAALTLNIFNRQADRVRMANIAQLANVLQTMWITDGDKLFTTPTYHVFRMYRPHMDARYIPVMLETEFIRDANGRDVPTLSATASQASDGSATITLVNPTLDIREQIDIPLPDGIPSRIASAHILTAPDARSKNTFESPDAVKTEQFKDAKIKSGKLNLTIPPLSIVSVTLSND